MENDLLMLGAYEMVDNMRSGRVTARVAKPFGTDQTFDDGCG